MGIYPRGNGMARKTGILLGEISEDEHRAGRPLLSCLVRRGKDGKPGNGFYVLARQLRLLGELPSTQQREAFLNAQCAATFAAHSPCKTL